MARNYHIHRLNGTAAPVFYSTTEQTMERGRFERTSEIQTEQRATWKLVVKQKGGKVVGGVSAKDARARCGGSVKKIKITTKGR